MGTKYKGTKKEIRALDTYIKLIRASDFITSKISRLLSKSGLTESQFNILDALYHLGPLSQRDLGTKLLKSGGNITMVVDNLEKRLLVKRKRGKKDRRQFVVHLTGNGKDLIEAVLPGQIEFITNEFSVLNNAEQQELQKLCKKIGFMKK